MLNLPCGSTKKIAFVWLIFAIIFSLLSRNSYAAISVKPMSLNLVSKKSGKPAMAELRVYNLDPNSTAYVSLHLYKGILLSTPQQRTEEIARPLQEAGLIISPQKVIVPRGQSRLIRIIRPKTVKTGVVYFLQVKPNAAAFGSGQKGVKVQVAYGVWVYSRPNPMYLSVKAVRKGKDLIVTNTGNTMITMRSTEKCQGAECPQKISVKLYVGIPRKVVTSSKSAQVFSLNAPGKQLRWKSP